jgi:adenylyltransferase/sulfurtransferase
MINDACVLLDIVLVYAAVSQYEGQVAVFNGKKNGTDERVNYRDLFPHPLTENEVLNCAEAGVLGVLTGIIGAMQANEVIKLITGIGEPLINRLLTYNSLNNQVYELDLSAKPGTRLLIPANEEGFKRTDYNLLCRGINQQEIDHHLFDELLVMGNVDVIDVREMNESPEIDEFPAYRIPIHQLTENLSVIKADTVVVICQSGKRSQIAAKQLAAIFETSKRIFSLQGGILEWKKQHTKQPA